MVQARTSPGGHRTPAPQVSDGTSRRLAHSSGNSGFKRQARILSDGLDGGLKEGDRGLQNGQGLAPALDPHVNERSDQLLALVARDQLQHPDQVLEKLRA